MVVEDPYIAELDGSDSLHYGFCPARHSRTGAKEMRAMSEQSSLGSRLDANAAEIIESMESDPLNFDYREPLWMEQHRMLRQMREYA